MSRLYFQFKNLKFNLSTKILVLIFFIGLIGNFIPFALISWSEIYIQSNTAGLLLSVAPIFALILSHFMTKDDKFSLKNTLLKIFLHCNDIVYLILIIYLNSMIH